MLVASGTGAVNAVLLASAIVPPLIVLAWFFLRAGKRHDQRERAKRMPPLT